MGWQIILFLSLVLSSLAVVVEKLVHNIQESNPIAFAVSFQFITGILIAVFGIIIGDFKMGEIRPIAGNLVLMSLFYGFGNVFYFRGLKLTQASVFTIISSLSSVFTVIGSIFFLKSSLAGNQIAGVALVLFSVLLANNMKLKDWRINKGFWFTLVGSICFGLAVVNDKFSITNFSVYGYLSLIFCLPALLMTVIYRKEMKDVLFLVKNKARLKFVTYCLFYGGQAVLYFTALKMATNSAVFASMAMTGSVLTVIMAIVLLKEKDRLWLKLVAAGVGLGGLVLLG